MHAPTNFHALDCQVEAALIPFPQVGSAEAGGPAQLAVIWPYNALQRGQVALHPSMEQFKPGAAIDVDRAMPDGEEPAHCKTIAITLSPVALPGPADEATPRATAPARPSPARSDRRQGAPKIQSPAMRKPAPRPVSTRSEEAPDRPSAGSSRSKEVVEEVVRRAAQGGSVHLWACDGRGCRYGRKPASPRVGRLATGWTPHVVRAGEKYKMLMEKLLLYQLCGWHVREAATVPVELLGTPAVAYIVGMETDCTEGPGVGLVSMATRLELRVAVPRQSSPDSDADDVAAAVAAQMDRVRDSIDAAALPGVEHALAAGARLRGHALVDVMGYEAQRAALHQLIIMPLHNAQLFQRLKVAAPKGILLHGPPGAMAVGDRPSPLPARRGGGCVTRAGSTRVTCSGPPCDWDLLQGRERRCSRGAAHTPLGRRPWWSTERKS